jgi:hypothetical protein
LGSFTNDLDQYIQAIVTIIQTFELAWKDVILLLDQTLTSLEQKRVLDQATQAGNDYHLQKSSVKTEPLEGEAEDPRVLTGAQAVPRMDPGWDPQSEDHKWARHHFIHLTTEGLKRARVKPLNYSQVTAVQQGPDGFPMAFLQHLKEAITKHTTVDPKLQVVEGLQRDKFLNQPQTFVENSKAGGQGQQNVRPAGTDSYFCIL